MRFSTATIVTTALLPGFSITTDTPPSLKPKKLRADVVQDSIQKAFIQLSNYDRLKAIQRRNPRSLHGLKVANPDPPSHVPCKSKGRNTESLHKLMIANLDLHPRPQSNSKPVVLHPPTGLQHSPKPANRNLSPRPQRYLKSVNSGPLQCPSSDNMLADAGQKACQNLGKKFAACRSFISNLMSLGPLPDTDPYTCYPSNQDPTPSSLDSSYTSQLTDPHCSQDLNIESPHGSGSANPGPPPCPQRDFKPDPLLYRQSDHKSANLEPPPRLRLDFEPARAGPRPPLFRKPPLRLQRGSKPAKPHPPLRLYE
ncbi:hypothetical protein AMATHDRAFT_6601 [Amanita thiersii Skay4041]|uniref:Uncharacterized protein n=1 Tax=Amanita thiersii Skay4041 TaxID=703135 RepID=A0A2A9NH70_9AGAR|nr:hypothetical protein AMATHDRAFT_6601 [Amanita thiersii Skay4041]